MAMILYVGTKSKSSWSLRPYMALAEAGAKFEARTIYLDGDASKKELADKTPAGRVPVLDHDGLIVWDSLAICEYAAEAFPSLWPQDPKQRAVARSVSAEMHSGFANLRQHMPMSLIVDRSHVKHTPEALADAARVMTIWRERLAASGGPFLFGSFSIADAMFAPVTTRFTSYEVEMDPVSRKYVDTVQALPSFKKWLAEAVLEHARDPAPERIG
jgi:glutathione S-transferase